MKIAITILKVGGGTRPAPSDWKKLSCLSTFGCATTSIRWGYVPPYSMKSAPLHATV